MSVFKIPSCELYGSVATVYVRNADALVLKVVGYDPIRDECLQVLSKNTSNLLNPERKDPIGLFSTRCLPVYSIVTIGGAVGQPVDHLHVPPRQD